MKNHRYTVEFRIFSSELNPSEITRELGLEPCQIRLEGSRRNDGKVFGGMWAYSGDQASRDYDSLELGIRSLLDQLWPHRDTIARYKEKGEIVFWCGHFQSSFDGGPSLSPELLKRLGEFGAQLYLDNYFSPEHLQPST